MIKNIKRLLTIIILPLLTLTGCPVEEVENPIAEPTATLNRIDISPSPIRTRGISQLTLAKGNKQDFIATGYYSDGSSKRLTDLSVRAWHSSDKNLGFFPEPGVFSAASAGQVIVYVIKDGVTSNTVTVDVTDAVITSIAVTPSLVSVAKGQTQQLQATATYSDTTSSDVSNSVTWSSNDLSTATVTSTGLLLGSAVGGTTLTATKDNITSNTVTVDVTDAVITSIAVTPSPVSVAKGQTQQLQATATYSDTTSSDVSNSVTWNSNDLSTATVTSTGLLLGSAVGGTTLTATKDNITSNTVTVDVTDAVITSIAVTPSPVSVAKGQTQQLQATATYSDTTSSDVSDSVTWTSNELNTATVTSTGLLLGLAVGGTTLTATKDNITSNTVTMDVTDAVITSIAVTPSMASVTKGQTQQLQATATYSDTTTSDVSDSVTWTSNDLSTVTVTPSGLLTGINVTGTQLTILNTSNGQLSGILLSNTFLTATKDGLTSNAASINVYECKRTGSSCLNFVDTGNGKLFTNSPSKLFLDNIIGGSANNGFTQEIGTSGPTGDFYLFNWSNADSLCATYNTRSLAGRSNWRLATKNELQGLFNTYGNMFTAHNWAVRINYWSGTRTGPGYYNVSLKRNSSGATMPNDDTLYASCVSVP
ncbi:Ig-like domain-containing protein [Vibrio chagasii]|uniref:Ig-like domain-containing protein n=1 Tax=Vibrio chagasii TaxID=170679 RepID=UPI0038CE0371